MVSAWWLRATLMSTMLPLWMSGGRRMEGNSIYGSLVGSQEIVGATYQSFVLGQQYRNTGIDFADGQ